MASILNFDISSQNIKIKNKLQDHIFAVMFEVLNEKETFIFKAIVINGIVMESITCKDIIILPIYFAESLKDYMFFMLMLIMMECLTFELMLLFQSQNLKSIFHKSKTSRKFLTLLFLAFLKIWELKLLSIMTDLNNQFL